MLNVSLSFSRRTAAQDHRSRRRHRPAVEVLEARTTVSDVVLGVVWPSLLNLAPARTTAPVVARTDSAAPPRPSRDMAAARGLLAEAEPAAVESVAAPDFLAVSAAASSEKNWAGTWNADDLFRDSFFDGSRLAVRARSVSEGATASLAHASGSVGRADSAPVGAIAVGGFQTAPTVAPAENPGLLAMLASLPGRPVNDPPQVQSGFEVSYQAGGYDDAGNFLGGTEVMQLVGHKGMLFAGTSAWMDIPLGDPRVGAQILRLDAPGAAWQLERHFDELMPGGGLRHLRVESMQSVTFTTDGEGHPLDEPVSVLLAGLWDATGAIHVLSRDDATGEWTSVILGTSDEAWGRVRSFFVHRDAATGVDRVFAGARQGIYSGVYDPAVPGLVRWDKEPELVPATGRPMVFTEAFGELHVAFKPHIYRRLDGPEPVWQRVVTYPEPPPISDGLRGLTTVSAPSGIGYIMIGVMDGGLVARVVPRLGYIYSAEFDIVEFLQEQWGGLGLGYVLGAYNDMPAVTDPRTGEEVNLIGLSAFPPQGPHLRSAFYLVRHLDATYELREVPPLSHPTIPNPVLRAVRTMVVSPFPEDEGRVVYLAGYDPNYIPSHNTAWIYKAPLEVILDGKP